jgi:hypothetical protein
MEGNTSRIIGTAMLITVGVGTLNSFYKTKKPPSTRFLIGSGAVYVVLSAIAEGEPEVAKALAAAVATTVVIGDGGGVLSYLNGHGETDTTRPKSEQEDNSPLVSSADIYTTEAGPFTPEASGLEEFEEHGGWAQDSSITAIRPQVFVPDVIGLFPGMVTN